jgi:O-acetyl-ADP-ribose deacetylase (regulator of RNase III)
MIHEVKGNLLTSGCDFICHQVNCQGKMNSGIARSIRETWPQVYEEYAFKCNGPKDKNDPLLGSVQFVETPDCTVINMFSQENYGYDGKRYTSYDAFWECLQRIKFILGPKSTEKIGFPKNIGCCRGGADWNVIKTMIEQVLGQDYHVYIYELEA